MSQEITVNLTFNVNNPSTGGGYSNSVRASQQYTQNAQGANGEVVSIPTTATNIDLTNLTTYGWAYFQNLDTTNFVTVGLSVSAVYYSFLKLKPGEIALLRLEPGITVQAQADTAAVKLNYLVLQD